VLFSVFIEAIIPLAFLWSTSVGFSLSSFQIVVKRVGQLSVLGRWLITSALPVLGQFVQQRLGLLQILGVKPFGEPVVDFGQQLVSFFFLALLLPQAAQAHHRPQLQRLGALATRNLDGMLKTHLCFFNFRLVTFDL